MHPTDLYNTYRADTPERNEYPQLLLRLPLLRHLSRFSPLFVIRSLDALLISIPTVLVVYVPILLDAFGIWIPLVIFFPFLPL
jgi:hypothetical protein